VAFEIKSKQTLNNPSSVAEIILSTFYESLGYSDAIYLARIEKRLESRSRYGDFKGEYHKLFGQTWEEGRKEHERAGMSDRHDPEPASGRGRPRRARGDAGRRPWWAIRPAPRDEGDAHFLLAPHGFLAAQGFFAAHGFAAPAWAM
jgi:hypothetical protein